MTDSKAELRALLAEAEINAQKYYMQAAYGYAAARSYGVMWAQRAREYRKALED